MANIYVPTWVRFSFLWTDFDEHHKFKTAVWRNHISSDWNQARNISRYLFTHE
jgi:hypothetical protein